MPVTGSEGTPRAYVCKALVNRELDDRKAPGVTHHPVGSRVVFRQHDFPTCYSPEGGGMSGAESPPANQQRGSQGKQQVDNPSVRRNPESESRPCQQRSQGHQKSRHAAHLASLVDRAEPSSYFTSERAAVGSHVIEPTGPMMGPDAVADVTPPGGRQTSR
jgi:hypothetical protein